MQRPRFLAFDALKILLALLVINVHYEALISQKPYSAFFYIGWYAVPLFIASSFYFNSKYFITDNKSLLIFWGKIKRLLFPLIFWSIIGFIIYPEFLSPTHVLRQLIFGTVVDVPLYYLCVMTALSVFWYIAPRKAIAVLLFVGLFIEVSGLNISIINALPQPLQYFPTRFIEFFKYAALGSLLPSLIPSLKKIPRLNTIILSLFIILFSIDIVWFWSHQYDIILYSGILQFLSVALLISLLALNLEVNLPKLAARSIQLLSKYTLGIYCIHFFFVENLQKFLDSHQINYQQAQIPSVILIFILCYLISFLIDKLSRGFLKNTVT